jgi:hypothetical protein
MHASRFCSINAGVRGGCCRACVEIDTHCVDGTSRQRLFFLKTTLDDGYPRLCEDTRHMAGCRAPSLSIVSRRPQRS